MNTINSIIGAALKDAGVEPYNERRRIASRVVKALADHKSALASELGVFKFIGYTKRSRPKTISPVAITRDHVPAYIANGEDE